MTLSNGPTVPAYSVHLPLVTGGDGIEGAAVNLLVVALDLYERIRYHADQQRRILYWDTNLQHVARLRVADMRARCYLAHVDPDGRGPNWWLTAGGVRLPAWYGQGEADNNVESIALNRLDPALVLDGWLASPHHRAHVLGEDAFWRGQTRCGIGVGPDWNTPMQQYIFCFLSCH